MSVVWMGPPPALANTLRRSFNISAFVETGTYLGRTARWASKSFTKVITIEASAELYRDAKQRLSRLPNVEVMHGSSEQLLGKVASSLTEPALFWLDAHWSGGTTFRSESECPVRQEIRQVLEANVGHFLLIDDVRHFLAPPPLPHDPNKWPSIAELLNDLTALRPKGYQAVVEDVLISVPAIARQTVVTYCQNAQIREDARRRRDKWFSLLSPSYVHNLLLRRF